MIEHFDTCVIKKQEEEHFETSREASDRQMIEASNKKMIEFISMIFGGIAGCFVLISLIIVFIRWFFPGLLSPLPARDTMYDHAIDTQNTK
jgi:hypothetical protein